MCLLFVLVLFFNTLKIVAITNLRRIHPNNVVYNATYDMKKKDLHEIVSFDRGLYNRTFVFVHLPKTGGTTFNIINDLKRYNDGSLETNNCGFKHFWESKWKEKLNYLANKNDPFNNPMCVMNSHMFN
jgi:hypothetical protein